MTIYAYYRVSTDKQDFENQKFGVVAFANSRGWVIDKEVVDNGISGTVEVSKRKLGKLIKKLSKGDILITSELSRLGRSANDVISTCKYLADKKTNCYLVKQGIMIDNSPMGKMMIAILSAFAEMERDLIAQRTKEALAKRRADGVKLGRPKGKMGQYYKLTGKTHTIQKLLNEGYNRKQICKKLHVSFPTLKKHIDSNL